AELFDDLLAHRVVEFGQHDWIEIVADQFDQLGALLGIQRFEKVALLGIVQRRCERFRGREVVMFECPGDGFDELGGQSVSAARFRFPFARSDIFGQIVHRGSSVWAVPAPVVACASTTASAVISVMPRALMVSCTTWQGSLTPNSIGPMA